MPCFRDLSCECGRLPGISGVGHHLSTRCSAKLEQISVGTTAQKPVFLLPVRGPGRLCAQDGSCARPQVPDPVLGSPNSGVSGPALSHCGAACTASWGPDTHLKAGAGAFTDAKALLKEGKPHQMLSSIDQDVPYGPVSSL